MWCESFNCHGFKASAPYVAERLRDCSVLCLSETWLRPYELNTIPDALAAVDPCFDPSNYVVFAKSSMGDIDDDYCKGRPYGGVAVICKKLDGLTWRGTELANDRLIGVTLNNGAQVLQTIIHVYLPYFESATDEKLTPVIECLDTLQAYLDKYGDIAPIKVCGDFNAQLPDNVSLGRLWYKSRGFNMQSKLLFDFILSNNMVAADLLTRQNVNYTYFCHKRNVYTWIDHVLTFDYDKCECKIISLEASNVSDHLPLRFVFRYTFDAKNGLSQEKMQNECRTNIRKLNWDRPDKCAAYNRLLETKLGQLGAPSFVSDREGAQRYVNTRMRELTGLIHSAAIASGCSVQSSFRPKAHWSADLTYLRDIKRFWWYIWVQNGRPREGAVFDCYKFSKKQFRKASRKCLHNVFNKSINQLNNLFRDGRSKKFWNTLKKKPSSGVSSLTANDFSTHFGSIMSDDYNLDVEQIEVRNVVIAKFLSHCDLPSEGTFSPDRVHDAILSLRRGKAAGIDRVTTEHLQHGLSPSLCAAVTNLFNVMLQWHVVADEMLVGSIVPVLKKPTLNPEDPASYRPITISTIYSKLLEILLMPDGDTGSCTQFGFKNGLGIDHAISFLNDSARYFNSRESPVYVCSLDAEKCFDRVWHDGLFFKLLPRLPFNHWLLLYEWYNKLRAVVKWNGSVSTEFRVTRGIRQGSVLSPILFTMFLDDLLNDLTNTNHGVRIAQYLFNHFAYADDINLLAASVPGLQGLIDICCSYARRWRFNFGLSKTTCIILGKEILNRPPAWKLNDDIITNRDEVDVLGVTLTSNLSASVHVKNRISSARRRLFGLQNDGLCFPGLSSGVKCYLWKTAVCPILNFGCHTLELSPGDIKSLESLQSDCVKRFLGIPKRSHHSKLLQATGIPRIRSQICGNRASLLGRIFRHESPCRSLNAVLLSRWLMEGALVDGTLLSTLVGDGFNPLDIVYGARARSPPGATGAVSVAGDGVVDSLASVIFSDRYNVPDSAERTLAKLLLRAF